MEKSPEPKTLDEVVENIKNIKFKRLDEVVENIKNMPDLAEVMRQYIIGQPQPNSDFNAKLASELVDGVLAKQGFGKQQLQYPIDGSTTLESVKTNAVINKFLDSKRYQVKPVSLKSYELNLRTFARYCPTLPLEPELIEKYLGRYNSENTGINNIDTQLRLLYDFASARLGLPNPMDKIKRPKGKAKPPQHLTITQALALVEVIQHDREAALVYCLLGLGLRLSEVRRLRIGDIGEDTIYIRGKERDEPMPLISEIRDALLKLTVGRHQDEPVFKGRKSKPLSDNMIQVIIKALFKRAGIINVRSSPHTLRHSRGVITDIAGLDDYSSRRLLRHADTQMTDRYSALNLEELKAKEEQYNPLRVLARQAGWQLGKRP